MNTDPQREENFEFSVLRRTESQCIEGMSFVIVPCEENKKFFLKVRIETVLYIVVYKNGNVPVCYGYGLIFALRDKIISQKKIFDCMTLRIDGVQKLKDEFKSGFYDSKKNLN